MPRPPSLRDTLSALLPADLKLTVYHISHSPTKSHPLYFSPPNQQPQPTSVESHFLAVSYDGILCFAIELLVYVTTAKHPETGKSRKDSTFFVSKADSSGYLPSSAASFQPKESPGIKDSTLRTISTAFLQHIVREHRLAHPKIRKSTISLFARSQASYLFPNSESNPQKHVLNDRALIRWWCRVLDPILQSFSEQDSTDIASAYLLVPGFDKYETMTLLPPKTRQPALYPNAKRWVRGHPLREDPARQLTVREVIPHFPDDPKARFLVELDAENTGVSGSWKQVKRTGAGGGWASVKTLDQFWEFMGFRQECSSGASTGFIWIVIDRKKQINESKEQKPSVPTPIQENNAETDAEALSPSEPIRSQELQPSQDTSQLQAELSCQATDASQPLANITSLRYTSTNYKKVLETLACGDFSTELLARLHSRKWIDGAATLLGNDASSMRLKEQKLEGKDWGMPIVGKRVVEACSTAPAPAATSGSTVNVLTVRKKHKRGDAAGTQSAQASSGVNVLGAGLIRKKPKLNNGIPAP
ncbi:histone acetylation protein-domain-containing protein [Tirmania nivea]|nr:histone acetylation protein-domain-containing protein [Tirmania nivea]